VLVEFAFCEIEFPGAGEVRGGGGLREPGATLTSTSKTPAGGQRYDGEDNGEKNDVAICAKHHELW
jgi:hypothetical protein